MAQLIPVKMELIECPKATLNESNSPKTYTNHVELDEFFHANEKACNFIKLVGKSCSLSVPLGKVNYPHKRRKR